MKGIVILWNGKVYYGRVGYISEVKCKLLNGLLHYGREGYIMKEKDML